MKKAVFCLAAHEEQTRRIVDRLFTWGFSNQEISIIYPDNNHVEKTHKNLTTDDTEVEGFSSKAVEGGATGAAAGGILGGSLGLLIGVGALVIPGLGPFIAAGPLMAALSGSVIGGSIGLFIGALVGLGIPEYEAKQYEEGLKKGYFLISVHTSSDEKIKAAREIMSDEGATNIASSIEEAKSKL